MNKAALIAVLLAGAVVMFLLGRYGTIAPCGMFRAAMVSAYADQPGASMGRAGGELAATLIFEKSGRPPANV